MTEKAEKQVVVVGLGNPGSNYAMTRHNMGYLVVQALAHALGWNFKEDKQFISSVTKGKIDGIVIHLLLPQTFMNESGQALRRYLDYYKLAPRNVVVVTDDVDLDFGQLRVRNMGSPGGHNGLKSIQAYLQTQHYVRLRMGIGRDRQKGILADYVLDTFSKEEKECLPEYILEGMKVLKRLIGEEVTVVMNSVNKRQKNDEKLDRTSGSGEKNE